jgi:hypothetical protein
MADQHATATDDPKLRAEASANLEKANQGKGVMPPDPNVPDVNASKALEPVPQFRGVPEEPTGEQPIPTYRPASPTTTERDDATRQAEAEDALKRLRHVCETQSTVETDQILSFVARLENALQTTKR